MTAATGSAGAVSWLAVRLAPRVSLAVSLAGQAPLSGHGVATADADEGSQVGAGELAELPGLLVQVADRVREGLPLVADVTVGGGHVVVLVTCFPVVLAVAALRAPQLALSPADLLKDLLDVLLKGLFQGAELFFERFLQPCGRLRGCLGFLVLPALAL